MREKLNAAYRSAAEEFAERLTLASKDRVDSVVLYGSVATGQAKRDSDVDILVISPDLDATRETASQICSDLEYERNFAFFISLVQFGREEFFKLRRLGDPFVAEIVNEGVIFYDNGTFSRVREEARAVGWVQRSGTHRESLNDCNDAKAEAE